MANKREVKAILAAEKQSQDKTTLAWRLIQLRARLNELLDIRKSGTVLSTGQRLEAADIFTAIKRTKQLLVDSGIPASVLTDSAKLNQLVRTMKHSVPTQKFRSGGAGVIAPGNSLKLWK